MTPKQQPTNEDIYQALNELRKELVTRDEQLEQKVVYGLIALAGAGFITALMGVVLK